jgi:hypothetical protein
MAETPTEEPLSFVEAFLNIVPPWLRRTRGAKVMLGLGDVTAELFHRTSDSIAARFPYAVPGAEDSLPYIGRDRVITRGPLEDDATYAARLATWWDAHKRRGGPYALLEQLYLFLVNVEPRQWDLVYRNGVRFILDGTAPSIDDPNLITRDKLTVSLGPRWARVVLFALYNAYPVITIEQRDAYTQIPRDWNAGHVEPIPTVAVWGGGVWDYPEGVLWDEPPDEYWDDGALVVNELYAAVPADVLTMNGEPVTMNSDYVTVNP